MWPSEPDNERHEQSADFVLVQYQTCRTQAPQSGSSLAQPKLPAAANHGYGACTTTPLYWGNACLTRRRMRYPASCRCTTVIFPLPTKIVKQTRLDNLDRPIRTPTNTLSTHHSLRSLLWGIWCAYLRCNAVCPWPGVWRRRSIPRREWTAYYGMNEPSRTAARSAQNLDLAGV